MLKVNNKKVIRDLAKTTYKANKKRNLLTIVAIFLTTFLLCTVISIGLSYWDTVSLRQQRMQGIDYDIELTEPRDDQVSTIRKMDNVKYAGLNVKCGIVSKYQDKELDKLKLYWLDDTCWKQQTIPALDYYKGSYPTKENEIMLSQSALRSIGIKNPKGGMELPFTYQTLAENSENNDTAKTFILSGWFMDYTGIDKGYVSDKFYQSTGVLQTDLTEGTLKISLKNPLYSENDIIEMQNEINLSGNQIIEADYDTISNFIKTMVGLFILLVLVFMSGYLFIYANNAKNILNHAYDYDIRLLNQTLLSDNEKQVFDSNFIEQIKSIDGVKDVRVLKSTTAVVPYQENVYGEYYKELYDSRYSPGNYEKDIEQYKKQPDFVSFTCRVVGIDEVEFKKINNTLQNPLDKEKFKNGEIAFVSKSFTQGDNGITGKKVEFSIPTALNPDKKEIIELGAIIDDYPAYYSAGYTPDLIVSNDFFDKIMGQPLIEMIKIDYDEPFSENVELAIKKLVANNKLISAESKLDSYSEMKNSENQITVLGGSLGIIIMLLAISNYLNMMSESIQNRSKEFAILESIGMTRKQIKKMIVFESLGYSILSIVIALIIGLPASYLVFTNFNIYRIPYVFPVIKMLLLFITIIIVCVVTSLFVFSKSKSETVIELLRKDEV